MLGAFSLAIFFIRLVYMKKTASHYAVLEAAVDSCLLTLSAICNQGNAEALFSRMQYWLIKSFWVRDQLLGQKKKNLAF